MATLEAKQTATNSLPLPVSNTLWTVAFVAEGAKATVSSSALSERGQLCLARDWKMLVDIGHLVFPPETATTTLRADLVLWSPSLKTVFITELNIPWEDSVDEAYEQKCLHDAELAVKAQRHGWNTEVRPVEGGCRGFVATSTTKLIRDLGLRGQSLHGAIKTTLETAERSSQWIWMKSPPGSTK